ncbi:hypothetical protein GCM10023237_70250 [Streptomyces coeruleoprunus]|uniref:DUF6381 family protein n=1 Tax=Streptomyces coeruleoprunus TaxID=285563 RepID=UPI0031EE06EF
MNEPADAREGKDLERTAEGAADPQEKQRLRDEARRLRERSEQESGMATGDIYPTGSTGNGPLGPFRNGSITRPAPVRGAPPWQSPPHVELDA